jgi:hypothetical protein
MTMAKSKALATIKVTPEQLIADLEREIASVEEAIIDEIALDVERPTHNDFGNLYHLHERKRQLGNHLSYLVPKPPTLTAEDVLTSAMKAYYALASKYRPSGETQDEDKFDRYMKMAVAIASKLG